MIIHLEAEWDDAILERFALVIAQQSLHFALQFNWILQGALEDYQPELPSGLPNPSYNPLYYARCIKLLTNLERCVVYGPRTPAAVRSVLGDARQNRSGHRQRCRDDPDQRGRR